MWRDMTDHIVKGIGAQKKNPVFSNPAHAGQDEETFKR